MTIGALNAQRFGERGHDLSDPRRGHSLEHLKPLRLFADRALERPRAQEVRFAFVTIIARQRAPVLVLHAHRVVSHHQPSDGFSRRIDGERVDVAEVALSAHR